VHDAASAWWAWIAPLSVQAAAFAAVVLVLDRLLARVGAPRLRFALWMTAALRLVVPPTVASPIWSASTTVADSEPRFDAAPLFAVWLVGVAAAAVLAVRAGRRVDAALRPTNTPPATRRLAAEVARRLGLRRVPRVVTSLGAPTAFVRGLLRPVVVLPHGAAPGDVEPMLFHELAHVKRGDLFVDAALRALCVVFWFHPAAWLAQRRAALLREVFCDATVVAAMGPRADAYRATLLRSAARLVDAPSGAAAFVGGGSQIVERLRALRRPPSRRPRLAGTASCLVAFALGCAALPPRLVDDESLVAARRLIASAMSGEARPGCLRLQLAAMRIAADTPIEH
jgi:beta-lactamase regulating signal transducer with metallopeptidase domain